jgi:hypothetical protein
MRTMRNWMLGAAMAATGLGVGTATAQSFEFGVYSRGPAAYIPPCPGAGYTWVAGYQSNGYWVPGRWNFVGARERDRYGLERDRGWGRGVVRGDDRDRGRNHERDRDRFRR